MTPAETMLWLFDELNCGAVLLDGLGSVIALNTCARRILMKQAKIYGWCMPGEPGGVSNLLRRLFGKEFASSECATIVANGAKSPARPLVASRIVLSSTTATEARLMLRVIDLDERPRPRIGVLRGAFGLTEAEARLAARLACGDSLQEIAADHKVAIDTPRAQLKSVLAKTQTHRQAELVALINRLTVLP